jgi:hypothetical protein
VANRATQISREEDLETISIETGNSVITVNNRITGNRSAKEKSVKLNSCGIHKAEHAGHKCL